MYKKIAEKLLKKVPQDYDEIVEDFYNTRKKKNWEEKFEMFLPYIKDGNILVDLGCGTGRFYDFLNGKRDVKYIGIDNSKNILKKALENHRTVFIYGDLLKIPVANDIADVVSAIASLHHVPSKKLRSQAIKEMHRILKKDGTLILTVWNLFQPMYKKYILKGKLRSIATLGAYDLRDTFVPWDKKVKRYYYAFKQEELRRLLKENNFEIIKEEISNNFIFICKKK